MEHGFEWALEQLRQGKKVCRHGWSGKGMYVVLQKGYPAGIPINQNTAEATGIEKGTVCRFLPYLMLKTTGPVGGSDVLGALTDTPSFVPWLASHTDLLETDWQYAGGNSGDHTK